MSLKNIGINTFLGLILGIGFILFFQIPNEFAPVSFVLIISMGLINFIGYLLKKIIRSQKK